MIWQEKLEQKIRTYLDGFSASHDYFHAERVRDNAMKIAGKIECDKEILEAAALLHDVGYKECKDDKKHYLSSMALAKKWLPEVSFPEVKIGDVIEAIRLHDNFGWDESGEQTEHIPSKIIQDADRIDALGAIGVARIAYYYGEVGFPIYRDDPVPESNKVWLNHSLLDQLRRDPMKKWENMNFEYSKQISKEKNDFLTKFYQQLQHELIESHGGSR